MLPHEAPPDEVNVTVSLSAEPDVAAVTVALSEEVDVPLADKVDGVAVSATVFAGTVWSMTPLPV
jgi:hypothetical protein